MNDLPYTISSGNDADAEPVQGNMDALNIGSYVHSLILEPEKTEEEFVIYSGTRRGKDWEAFSEE